jgi:hypothetical protein
MRWNEDLIKGYNLVNSPNVGGVAACGDGENKAFLWIYHLNDGKLVTLGRAVVYER